MNFLKLLLVIFTLTFLNACKSTVKTNLLAAPNLEKNSSLVVLYYVPEYKINYMEEGFMHEDRKGATFSGVWDLEGEMTKYLSSYLNSNGFNSIDISKIIKTTDIKKYIMSPQESDENKEARNLMLDTLNAKGEKFLVEVYLSGIEASTDLVSNSGLYGWLNFKVTDVKSKAIVLHNYNWVIYRFEHNSKNIKKAVEENDLLKFKSFLKKSVDTLTIQSYAAINEQATATEINSTK